MGAQPKARARKENGWINAAALWLLSLPGQFDSGEHLAKVFLAMIGGSLKPEYDRLGIKAVAASGTPPYQVFTRTKTVKVPDDVKGLAASTPIVVFAHVPLWTVYPEWGWGTDDGAEALSLLKRFGSVTVMNGHIHQIMQKVEGNVAFHTARSTAFPQPEPGKAEGPGPLKVPPDKLRQYLGVTDVSFLAGDRPLAFVDKPLG